MTDYNEFLHRYEIIEPPDRNSFPIWIVSLEGASILFSNEEAALQEVYYTIERNKHRSNFQPDNFASSKRKRIWKSENNTELILEKRTVQSKPSYLI